MMMNELKWIAELQEITETVDENDRPIKTRIKKRDLRYIEIGITAQEKYLSRQEKTDVVRRIKCRYDKTISEKDNGVKIGDTEFNITRIYVLPAKREMELSLAYVD